MPRQDGLLHLVAILGAFALFAVLCWPALSGRVYAYDDLGNSHLPVRHFYARALAEGFSPLWAPQFHCGHYLHGDGLVGMLHPGHFLLYRLLPLWAAFDLEFLLSYAALFLGTYWMLRRFQLPAFAAVFGATSFTFGGFNLLHFPHMNAVAVIAHVPMLIALADLTLETQNRSHRALARAGIAALTGSQLLLGYPQYVLYSLIAEASFVAFRLRGQSPRAALGWLWCKSLGGLLGMAQILPTWESLAASVRREPSLEFRLSDSLHPLNLIQLWSPLALRGHVYGKNAHELGLFAGSFCTVALAWPLVGRWTSPARRALAWACAALALAALVLALGRYGLVYPWIARLPPFGLFRIPARHIVLVHLGLSALAAIVLAELRELARQGWRPSWRELWPLAIPAGLSLATAGLGFWALAHPVPGGPALLSWTTYSTGGRVLGGTVLVCAAAALTALAARGLPWSLAALALMLPLDCSVWALDYFRRGPTPTLEALVASALQPPDAQPGRLSCPPASVASNILTMKGYSLSGGYVALEPARSMPASSERFQVLAGVRWRSDGRTWRRVAGGLPRARLAPTGRGKVVLAGERPGLLELDVEAPMGGTVLLSESFHSGWKALLDGKPVPVARTEGDFMGVAAAPGSRRLTFTFAPESYRWGLLAAAVGLGLVALSAAFEVRA